MKLSYINIFDKDSRNMYLTENFWSKILIFLNEDG